MAQGLGQGLAQDSKAEGGLNLFKRMRGWVGVTVTLSHHWCDTRECMCVCVGGVQTAAGGKQRAPARRPAAAAGRKAVPPPPRAAIGRERRCGSSASSSLAVAGAVEAMAMVMASASGMVGFGLHAVGSFDFDLARADLAPVCG